MLVNLNKHILENNVENSLLECLKNNDYHTGLLLSHIFKTNYSNLNSDENFLKFENEFKKGINGLKMDGNFINVEENVIDKTNRPILKEKTRVKLLCNWLSSKDVTKLWNKMSKGNYTWNNIEIVLDEEPVDYYVVINCPLVGTILKDSSKVILFHMEPNIPQHPEFWGDWATKKKDDLKFVGRHDLGEYNNIEWHLSKTYEELMTEKITKNICLNNVVSTVFSDKYKDPGHIKRIDFAKFVEQKGGIDIHSYGGNKFNWKHYRGSLPYHEKDNALIPYKYTFNVENFEIRNYFTEKLVDGILSETLVFYHGCPNIAEFINPKAFVWLDLIDFEKDYLKVKEAIENNLWEERLPYIKEAKNKILNELQFFPRLERIINQK